MDDNWGEWNRKGASLSDKTARREFGLTQEEIYRAIDAGRLQYRQQAMHGTPFLRFLRREVEAEVARLRGGPELQKLKLEAELAKVESELRALKMQIRRNEELRDALRAELGS
ncbi:MAG: hypothetical protein MUE73_04515 [Planctomycetes bacterium]|jgi:hypothetical protein|nr:hypothetical protein [Planctomycetota bacterium]